MRRPLRRPPRTVLAALAAGVLAVIALACLLVPTGPGATQVPISDAVARIDAHTIRSAQLSDSDHVLRLTTQDGDLLEASYPADYSAALSAKLIAAHVHTEADGERASGFGGQLALELIPIGLIGVLLVVLSRRGFAGRATSAKIGTTQVPDVRFTDVAGAEEAVFDLREAVALLREPDRFAATGGQPHRGYLLEGEPGTGKTLLAKAVAGEAGVPFLAVSGSDFLEMYVGVGAKRIRDVFARAARSGRAVIFIDEIDGIGARRGSGDSGYSDEQARTLNALLTEMDGFTDRTGVLVLAATNRADLLDSALTRPGRFDRKITVPLPDRAAREQILRLYAAKRPMAPDVDLAALARRTPGMSGAELASLLNEASLVAGRRGARAVESPDVEDALGTVALGRERRGGLITERDRRITAWHEAGHTVAALLQEHAHDPVAVSIVPRGGAGGVTWMSGGDDAFTTRSQALADLVVSMAGRAAEELLLHGDYTQGACGDLTSATRTAHRMITQWGMSSLGMALRTPEWLTAGTHADRVQDETDAMLAAALDTARTLVVAELPFLRAVADRLLEEETLDGDAVREIARTVRGSDALSAATAQVGVFVPAPRASAAAGLVAATTPDSGAA